MCHYRPVWFEFAMFLLVIQKKPDLPSLFASVELYSIVHRHSCLYLVITVKPVQSIKTSDAIFSLFIMSHLLILLAFSPTLTACAFPAFPTMETPSLDRGVIIDEGEEARLNKNMQNSD